MEDPFLAKFKDSIAKNDQLRKEILEVCQEKSNSAPGGLFLPEPALPEFPMVTAVATSIVDRQEKSKKKLQQLYQVETALAQYESSAATIDKLTANQLTEEMTRVADELESNQKLLEALRARVNDVPLDEVRKEIENYDAVVSHNKESAKKFDDDSEYVQAMDESNKRVQRYYEQARHEAGGNAQELQVLISKHEKNMRDFKLDMNTRMRYIKELYRSGDKTATRATQILQAVDSLEELENSFARGIESMQFQKKQIAKLLTKSIKAQSMAAAPDGTVQSNAFPMRTDRPVVSIFEMYPPPSIDLNQSVEKLQKNVQQLFHQFKWPAVLGAPAHCDCEGACAHKDRKSKLNLAQKLTYHYMQPYNVMKGNIGANALLMHSAGSGKSCTAAMVASIFGRAGYTIMVVSKKSIKEQIEKASIFNQCDVNLQQYLKGNKLADMVVADVSEQLMKGRTFPEEYDPLITYVRDKIDPALLPTASTKAKAKAKVSPQKGKKKKVEEEEEEKEEEEQEEEEEEEDSTIGYVPIRPGKLDKTIKTAMRKYVQGEILDRMGIDYYKDSISYEQFCNLQNEAKNGSSTKRLLGSDTKPSAIQLERQQSKDKLRKTIIIIDEAHKLVTNPTEKIGVLNFEKARAVIWESYQKSVENSCRVLLLTATPVVDHPMDAINLLTMLNTKEKVTALGFEKYGKINDDTESKKSKNKTVTARDVAGQQFMKDHWNYETNSFKYPDKIKQLFNGTISYFNFTGDPATFSQPFDYVQGLPRSAVTYIPVKLSVTQANLIMGCFEATFPQKVNPAVGQHIVNGASGYFNYDVKTQLLSRDKTKKIKKSTRVVDTMNAKVACVGRNSVWPDVSDNADNSTIDSILSMDRVKRDKFLSNDTLLQRTSPLMYQLIEQVSLRNRAAQRDLELFYRAAGSNTPIKDRLRNYKQYIFNDLTGRNNIKSGTKMIQALLESRGYTRINIPGGRTLQLPEYKEYKGMIVFDESITSKSDTKGNDKELTEKEIAELKNLQESLLDRFNAPDNKDGKECAIFVGCGTFKEGIDLFGIRYVHIVGLLKNQADMIQAVARGIRQCSRSQTPYAENRGWTINIDIYSPTFEPKPGHAPTHPLQLLEAYDPDAVTIQTAIQQMNELLIDSAYDKLLLSAINNHSRKNEDSVQLWENRLERSEKKPKSRINNVLPTKEDVVLK